MALGTPMPSHMTVSVPPGAIVQGLAVRVLGAFTVSVNVCCADDAVAAGHLNVEREGARRVRRVEDFPACGVQRQPGRGAPGASH